METTLPAAIAAANEAAPSVSIATIGTSAQPTSSRPSITPTYRHEIAEE